ncbi:MAG: glyoxalase [Deltaproteobacteria bacterium]|nr:glyoxalase [Deltaproteobacteria bacterium]
MPVDDLATARALYGGLLGCREGRSAPRWVDFDFYGHQLSLHLAAGAGARGHKPVDGDAVPVPHFGVILRWDDWQELCTRLAGQPALIGPRIRFAGEAGEQGTLFVRDPAGNALEFKSFRDPSRIFATS